ncbi:MAG: hypothetical protein ABT10_02750 [Novosphingobium sp. SCN 63-17]|uniref:GGDEF domain-containing protein n=2 Tax=unclassified Novosphingobium TaxID=2644732 RepID=UPI00086A5BE1|nr:MULTISPECIES: GGDEF domain-containing protein [unclassified Novosphingobium]MBN9143705.1 GGDEF domain-containing protein [Novosphingobium sp.]ODU84320.1 MAG: hypothetical protein ABT10_02750 [Novosphingobium sp. SCN 63-17]OJX92861.1 MAG: hypothetical protein BGP00_23355 [Novosphingobium sp. 63-713]
MTYAFCYKALMIVSALATFGVAATSLLLAIALLAAFWRFGRARHAILWGTAFLFITFDHTLMAVRLLTSGDHVLITVMATMGSLGGATLIALGFRERSGLHEARWISVFLAIVAVASFALILGFPANPMHRPLVTSYVTVMLILGIDSLRKGSGEGLAAGRVTQAMMALFAGFFAVLTVLGVLTVPWGSMSMDPYRAFYLLGVPASLTGIGLFALFLLAEDLAHELRQLAIVDPLTGLLNRRGFEEAARRIKAQCRRHGLPVCVAIADLDHFKSINDRFGHQAGDRVLVEFARRLRGALREGDLLSRSGGEEFVMLLPGVTGEEVGDLLNRLRTRLPGANDMEVLGFAMPSMSVGAVEVGPRDLLASCLERADRALYQAKSGGRDCVRVDGRLTV